MVGGVVWMRRETIFPGRTYLRRKGKRNGKSPGLKPLGPGDFLVGLKPHASTQKQGQPQIPFGDDNQRATMTEGLAGTIESDL